jgi:phenylalanyl-tRNA synthetase alpha subunit
MDILINAKERLEAVNKKYKNDFAEIGDRYAREIQELERNMSFKNAEINRVIEQNPLYFIDSNFNFKIFVIFVEFSEAEKYLKELQSKFDEIKRDKSYSKLEANFRIRKINVDVNLSNYSTNISVEEVVSYINDQVKDIICS